MNKSFVAVILVVVLTFSFNAQAESGYSADIERALTALKNATESSKKPTSNKYYNQRITSLMKEIGYDRVKLKSKNQAVTFDADGRKLVLFIKKNGDLQLFFAVSGDKWNYQTINEWNRDNRLSRAYLDKDSEPVLESDLMSGAGLSDEQITDFVRYFTQFSMNNFRRFLIEKSQNYDRYNNDARDYKSSAYADRYNDDRYNDDQNNDDRGSSSRRRYR